MLRIFYISAAARRATPNEIDSLLAVARKRNRRDNITGVLLYHEGSFAQVLEGPEKAVRECFHRIESDRRHSGCSIILEEYAPQRLFGGWDMGFVLVTKIAASDQSRFMTPQQFLKSQQFATVQSHLVLKSFLQSFCAKTDVLTSTIGMSNGRAKLEGILESDRPAGGLADDFTVPHNAPSTDYRSDWPAGNLRAVEWGPAALRRRPVMGNHAPGFQIDNGEISVIAGGDAPFAGNAENTVGTVADEIDKAQKTKPALGEVVEHNWDQRLHAGHSGRRGRIGLLFFLKRMRRMIGTNHVNNALRDACPQPAAMRRLADRRVHLGQSFQALITFGRGER